MTGLKWFRIDVMFEDKFELVCAEYGSTAFEVIVRLWQKIYSAGYYLEWNDEVALLFAKRHSLGGNVVSEIVKCAVRRGLFDKGMFDKHGVLTSHGIQEWYFDSVERRKSVEVVKDYLLTDVTQKLQNADIIWKNVSKNDENADISQHITNSTNKTGQDKKESKKEIYKNSTTNTGAREVDFSAMTDEELVSWGECPIDIFSDEGMAMFGRYMDEVNRRKERAPASWKGKIIKGKDRFERLKSHQEIMDEWRCGQIVQEALKEFLRHCYINGHLVTNDKLIDILVRLRDWYGSDENGMCDSLKRAINGGYFDIREGRK